MNSVISAQHYQVSFGPYQLAQNPVPPNFEEGGYQSDMLRESTDQPQIVTRTSEGEPVYASNIYWLFFALAIGFGLVYLVVLRARKNGLKRESPFDKDNSAFQQ